MAKIRVHELASELKVESRAVLERLMQLGEFASSSSSSVEGPVAERVRSSFGATTRTMESAEPRSPRDQANTGSKSNMFDPSKPSARQFGWTAGAVASPQHPDLLANIDRVARKYPVLRDHIAALKRLGSQVVYAGFSKQHGFNGCGVVHARFSGAIETGFGFTRELMIFYTPHEDLQGRTFDAAKRELGTTNRSVTPDIFFIWSPDQKLRIKLHDWSKTSSLAIPLIIDDEDPLSLITLLRDYIYTRDLFYVTTPVSGASFFGRKTLLQSLRDDVINQQVAGLFGLRKSGKTSVLLQLQQELNEDGVVTVLMDLEAFSSPPDDPTDDILSELRRRLIEELKARRFRTKELSELTANPSILALKNALQSILRHLNRDGPRILLLLDEIEYLTPADRIDIAEGDMPRIAQFLAALRSIVQESDNFTFVLSGLTSAIIESGRLYGRPNPLFSWAKAIYVNPLERGEADDLATTVGGKMGIHIDEGALSALHEASGGHAYLYRNLSSSVVQHLPKDAFHRSMTRSSVLRELGDWKSRVQGNVDEMIQHVKRYYPDEAFMLELLIESPEDFNSLASSEHVAVRRLKDLGLIHESREEYAPNVILDLT